MSDQKPVKITPTRKFNVDLEEWVINAFSDELNDLWERSVKKAARFVVEEAINNDFYTQFDFTKGELVAYFDDGVFGDRVSDVDNHNIEYIIDIDKSIKDFLFFAEDVGILEALKEKMLNTVRSIDVRIAEVKAEVERRGSNPLPAQLGDDSDKDRPEQERNPDLNEHANGGEAT